MDKGVVLNKNLRVNDTIYVGEHTFGCGHKVPVFEVNTIHVNIHLGVDTKYLFLKLIQFMD